MARHRGQWEGLRQRPPTFFWQGVLMGLPVLVLAVIGILSLRQDRILARVEATERAQALAEDLAARIEGELRATPAEGSSIQFTMNARGDLLQPPPLTVLRPQPLELFRINQAQAVLWQTLQSGETDAALNACREFLHTGPPPDFAALATYRLGLLEASALNFQSAAAAFESVCTHPLFRELAGETGVPLLPLAALKRMELQRELGTEAIDGFHQASSQLAAACLAFPTPMAPLLLQKAAELEARFGGTNSISRAQAQWERHERVRSFHALLRRQLPLPLATPPRGRLLPAYFGWVSEGPGSGSWLAVMHEPTDSTNVVVSCHLEGDVARLAARAIAANRSVPAYGAISLAVAGKEIVPAGALPMVHTRLQPPVAKGWNPAPGALSLLASAARMAGNVEFLKVNVHLLDPRLLYARQEARSFSFGLLIVVSVLAAGIGFAAAWRAFRRQQRLADMKTNFVSSVSHELRAPIASVRLMAEGLENGRVREPAKQHEYFRFIVQECRRLSALIENVLDFARIEQGRKQYEFEATDLNALVAQTVKIMEPAATERQVALEQSAPGAVIAGCMDGRAIQQALVNLIDNAVKHSPAGAKVVVGLELASDDQPASANGQMIAIFVQDHGEGIPAEEHERIFERFYRRGSELRRQTQGVGIGLSIVKHIVEAHGGRVLVQSQVGQGSRFTMALPL